MASVLWLVRHAHAGSRSSWEGGDLDRPLTPRGVAEANAIGEWLAADEPLPIRLVSSPYLRCTQTLGPLARALALEVEVDSRLAEGAGDVDWFDWVRGSALVACSHGDVIPYAVTRIVGEFGLQRVSVVRCAKASVWRFDGNDTGFTGATYREFGRLSI